MSQVSRGNGGFTMALGFSTRFLPFWHGNRQNQASTDCRFFQANNRCHLYFLSFFFLFLHTTVLINYLINYFCSVSENRWHQCSQNSCCNGELNCIVYLCCCFLPVNWCRSYSFSVQIFPWNLLYKTEDLLPLQRFCYQRALLSREPSAHAFSTRGRWGVALFCRLWRRLEMAAEAWEPF